MTGSTLRSFTTCLCVLGLAITASAQPCEFEFGEPQNLGPVVNSSSDDVAASITGDGLALIFSSRRPGGIGDTDLWMTTRGSVHDPWQSPVNLGQSVNTPYHDGAMSITADGLMLVFASRRPGGFGRNDLWMTTRLSARDPWETPVNLGPTVNTSVTDKAPGIAAHGLTLYFTSNRPGAFGGEDVWMTTRASLFDPWEVPVNLGPEVNTSRGDGGPAISADGLALLLASDRSGGFGRYDLWMTSRTRTTDPWESPVNLGPLVNTSLSEAFPDLSFDGSTLFFSSTRPGGSGGSDLWQVYVIQHCGCVRDPAWICDGDVDGDGQVNPVDVGLVMAAFGLIDDQDLCNYDVDCNEQINPVDAGIVLSLFGSCEPPRDVCP